LAAGTAGRKPQAGVEDDAMTCDSCNKQFFAYLYDLLDPVEREDLDAHLHECAHCLTELERTRTRRDDIATAVKLSFPEVTFKTPRPTAKVPHKAPPPRVQRPPLLLRPWAIAASLVLAVLSAGAVGAWSINYYQSDAVAAANQRFDDAQAKLNDVIREVHVKKAGVQQNIQAIQREIDGLMRDWDQRETKVLADHKQKRARFEVTAPRSVQAGAPNRFDLEVRPSDPKQPARVSKVTATVVDEKTKQPLFAKQFGGGGKNFFVLPPDLPVKPGADLALVLEADVDGTPAQVREHLSLVFPEYITHLTTDRPMYRPGEVVRFRSLTLERFSLQPAAEELNLRYRLTAPNGAVLGQRDVSTKLVEGKDKRPVLGPDGEPLHGLGAGEFTLSRDVPGGVYTLSVIELNDRFHEEQRSFVVHRWQAPRFNKEAAFDRASYGPGDRVEVHGRVTRLGQAAGGVPAPPPMFAQPGGFGMPGGPDLVHVRATAVIDGVNQAEVPPIEAGPDGAYSIAFTLPNRVERGGTLTLYFEDRGTFETLIRPIPIVLRDVAMEFFPEGGYLIAGVPNRVYFQARTGANGKPADIRGRLLEVESKEKKREVARFQTLSDEREPGINQGLGTFTFVPRADRRYEVKVDMPVGINKLFLVGAPTPNQPPQKAPHEVKTDGVVLHLPRGVVTDEIPVTLYSAGRDRELLVGAYCRGRLLDTVPVKATAGQKTDVVLHPAGIAGGVYRVTVFEKQPGGAGTPYRHVAERLLFRKQTAQLHVACRPDRDSYVPGERVTIDLEARNELKQVSPAVAMFAVVDASVLNLVNEKSARSMPTHFLLTTEIRQPEDLENADVLLGDHPRAAEALDLLLGSQGWRRFAEQDPQTALSPKSKTSKRASYFLASTKPVEKVDASEQDVRDRIDRDFVGKFISLEEKLAEKEREEAALSNGQPEAAARSVVAAAGQMRSEQEQRSQELWGFFGQAALGTTMALFLFFAFFLVSTSLYRLAEGRSGYIFLGGGLCLLAMLFVISVLGTFAMIGTPPERGFFNRNFRGGRFAVAAPAPPVVVGDVKVDVPMADVGPPPGIAPELRADQPPNGLDEVDAADNAGGPGMAVPGQVNVPRAPVIVPPGGLGPNDSDERTLRQRGNFQALLKEKLGRRVTVPASVDSSVVREYAHRHKAGPDQVRKDFAETLCWQPALVLKDGQASVQFDLSDAVTHFRVLVVSHSLDGRLGTDSIEIAARLPYEIEPKLPTEIAAGDRLAVPVAVSNRSNEQTTVTLKLAQPPVGLKQIGDSPKPFTLEAGQTARHLLHFEATGTGKATLRVQGDFAKGVDTVERSFRIAPDGFPGGDSYSGTLDGSVPAVRDILMPKAWIPGSLTVQVHAYPSILADLQSSLDAMLKEPHGCFEQSSSSNYPNVLILNYLQDTKQASPAVEKRARALLDTGYDKLLTFECIPPDDPKARRGYEWFGQTAPPHEALTAYGLLQFHDMSRVYSVDQAMVARTQKFLLDQRDGKGGFKRNPQALDQFGRAPQNITNAYIVWALTETGAANELDTELNALYAEAKKSQDPYFLALVSLGQLKAQRTEQGLEIVRRLNGFQKSAGEVAGARTSITSSAGRDLLVETTALAALAWLRAAQPAEFQLNAQKAGRWLLAQRNAAGSFGATQSTILALKTLIAFAADNQKGFKSDQVRLEITHENGGPQQQAADVRVSSTMTEPAIVALKESVDIDKQPLLMPGRNHAEVRLINGQGRLPFTLSWSYRTRRPDSSAKAPVQLTAALNRAQAKEGDTIKLKASLENRTGENQGMAVAVIGLPAGLSLPEDFAQLNELKRPRNDGKEPGVISYWELNGRELVLYWRELKAGAQVDLDLDVVCRLPGVYSGPASRAYLYYNAEHKQWLDPLSITILPAQ
jgi:hypothetical protein